MAGSRNRVLPLPNGTFRDFASPGLSGCYHVHDRTTVFPNHRWQIKRRGWLRTGSIILIDTMIGAAPPPPISVYERLYRGLRLSRGAPAAACPSRIPCRRDDRRASRSCAALPSSFSHPIAALGYVSTHDVVTFLKASGAAVSLAMVRLFLVTPADNVPRSVPVFTFIFMMTGLIGIRLAYRMAAERVVSIPRRANPSGNLRRVLLLGLTRQGRGFHPAGPS